VNTITIAAHNRPRLLRRLLNSLRGQLVPLDEWQLFIRIDAGGDKFDAVKEVAGTVDFAPFRVFWPGANVGINRNTYWLMHHAFDNMGADYNVYLEDDLLLSSDAFNLVEWYIAHADEIGRDVGDVGAYCLCRLHSDGDPSEVFLSRALVGWGFVMGRHQWQRYGAPAWCKAMEPTDTPKMWDNLLANYIRACGADVYNAFPALSRVTNTGRQGEHFTLDKYDKLMDGHRWQRERRAFEYRFVGVQP
jgi:glycosyltransferase involved in cell wall biosynthesis